MKTSLVILLAVICAATCQPVYGSDKDFFEDVNELLSTHWKIEASTHQPGFKSDISRTDLEASLSKISGRIAEKSAGKLTSGQVLLLLKPKADGTAPDWTAFRKMFKEQNDYFVESYLEPATPNGKSSGPQVVSGEVGRIQRKESRSIAIGKQSETLEIIWLSPRGTTYAGVLSGFKKAGSFAPPSTVVLDEQLIKKMAQTPWNLRVQLEQRFGTNYSKAETETAYRIRSGFDPSESSLMALLTWRQLQRTTLHHNEAATEAWMIDASTYRARIFKDQDLPAALKALERSVSVRNATEFLSDFGAMGRSEIPLFILVQMLQTVAQREAQLGPAKVDHEEMAWQFFCSYLQECSGKYPQLELRGDEVDRSLIIARLGRLSTAEIIKICDDFYPRMEAYWLLTGTIHRAFGNKASLEELRRIQTRCMPLVNQSAAINALLGEAFYANGHEDEAVVIYADLQEQLGSNRTFVGAYERLAVARAFSSFSSIEVGRNNLEKGRSLLEDGLKINPLHTMSHYKYARIQAELRDLEGAMRSLNECIRLEIAKDPTLRSNPLLEEAKRLKAGLEGLIKKN